MQNPSSTPTVGIVIAIGARTDDLDAQLDALRTQDHTGPVHLVLSCNSAPVAVIQAQAEHGWPANWTVTFVDSSDQPGAGPARNIGTALLDTDVVLFCDADDVVDRAWVRVMAGALREHSIVGGTLRFDRVNAPHTYEQPAWTSLGRRFHHLPYAASCNLGMHRDLFEQIGGFDPRAVTGQDTDICWRAAYAGHPIAYCADAVVDYRLRPDTRGVFRNALRYGTHDPLLLRLHRPHGAKNLASDSARAVLAAGWAVLRLPLGPRYRRIAAERVGAVLGRARGSIRYRQFTL